VMGLVSSLFGSVIGLFLPDRPYWAVKLHSGKWLSELDMVRDEWQREDEEDGKTVKGKKRPLDWTLDLVSTGDVRRIAQLWLFCPPNPFYPRGQSDFLEITRPGTAFQLKVRHLHAWGNTGASSLMASELIGRVDDPISGACTCKVWDSQMNVMGNWSSSIYDMGSWRDGVSPLHALDLDVQGLLR